jgi:ketosteroid isomerase-like protein
MNPILTSPGNTPVEIERQLREWLDGYFAAVERRDLPSFLSCFYPCESFSVFEDKQTYGWKEFTAFAEGFFGFVVKVTLELEHCSVDAFAPDVAVATGVFCGAGEDYAGKPVKVRSAFTFVLHRIDHEWKIRHVHESSLE